MSDPAPRPGGPALAALYLAGLLHWGLFFGWGVPGFRMSFTVADWPKEYRYYSVLQQAAETGRIPYYVSRPIHETRKFLSIPEATWSPQVLLLRGLSIQDFVVVNTLLLYSVGFVGCLLLQRRASLSLLPFTFLFLLVNFNGHLTAHLAIGHSMWVAYFFLPWFLAFLLDLRDEARRQRAPLLLAIVLFAVVLQGGLHIFVWCVLLLLLVGLCNPPLRLSVAWALFWSGLLAAFRLLPAAAVLLGKREQAFLSGYPDLRTLLEALLVVRTVTEPKRGGAFGELSWWELDVYVGLVGIAWLLFFGIYRRFRPGARPGPPFRFLEVPLAAMAVLAMGDAYAWINVLGVPLLGSQRVSSRMLILPLLALTLFAASRMPTAGRPRERWTAAAGALVLALMLAHHSRVWSLPSVEAAWPAPPRTRDLAIEALDHDLAATAGDALYRASVLGSAALSAAALVVVLFRLRSLNSPLPTEDSDT